jgi:hypothetical protein
VIPGAAPTLAPTAAASASVLGQFMASSFVSAPAGQGATPIAEPPLNQHPQLAQPHAA